VELIKENKSLLERMNNKNKKQYIRLLLEQTLKDKDPKDKPANK